MSETTDWIVDFLQGFGEAAVAEGGLVDQVQKVLNPTLPNSTTTVPVTPIQATPDVKTAQATASDTVATPSVSPVVLAIGAVVLFLLLE